MAFKRVRRIRGGVLGEHARAITAIQRAIENNEATFPIIIDRRADNSFRIYSQNTDTQSGGGGWEYNGMWKVSQKMQEDPLTGEETPVPGVLAVSPGQAAVNGVFMEIENETLFSFPVPGTADIYIFLVVYMSGAGAVMELHETEDRAGSDIEIPTGVPWQRRMIASIRIRGEVVTFNQEFLSGSECIFILTSDCRGQLSDLAGGAVTPPSAPEES